MKTCYTREQIEAAVKSKGYKWFEDHNDKGYDVNIVGVRNSATKNKVTNKFDDCITVSYKKEGKWKRILVLTFIEQLNMLVKDPQMLINGLQVVRLSHLMTTGRHS